MAQNFKDNTLYEMDNLVVLRGMNSETVDLIATDPRLTPNEIGVERQVNMLTTGNGETLTTLKYYQSSGNGTKSTRSGWKKSRTNTRHFIKL